MLEKVEGAADVKLEQTTGLPMLTVQIDREKTARFGINVADVQNTISMAVGGQDAGVLFEGDRRFNITVRLPEELRNDLQAIARLPIQVPNNTAAEGNMLLFVQLGDVAKLDIAPGPNQISRENGKRRVVVTANVRGRDIGSFVADAQSQIEQKVKVPAGYWVSWGAHLSNYSLLPNACKLWFHCRCF